VVRVESEEPADISVGLELARVRSSHSEQVGRDGFRTLQ
jgi:hypothetical protein